MPETAQFRYAQARLQARLGDRAGDPDWRRLAGSGDLAGTLQAAAHGVLRAWTEGLHAGNTSHDIELALRRRYRDSVAETAGWLPARWAAVVRPLATLPDLPALQHLLGGHAAPAWMLDDPALRPFASGEPSRRAAALGQADTTRWLAAAWQRDIALPEAWYDHWRGQWPRAPRQTAGLREVGQLLLGHLRALREEPGTATERQRTRLLHQLTAAIHRYSCQPAASCAHLGIVALDLERLRSELVDRALFPARAVAVP